MTSERLLKVLDLLRMDESSSIADFAAGYNKALENVAKSVRFEDAVMAGIRPPSRPSPTQNSKGESAAGIERAARLSEWADR